jgi:hypothetical protein
MSTDVLLCLKSSKYAGLSATGVHQHPKPHFRFKMVFQACRCYFFGIPNLSWNTEAQGLAFLNSRSKRQAHVRRTSWLDGDGLCDASEN